MGFVVLFRSAVIISFAHLPLLTWKAMFDEVLLRIKILSHATATIDNLKQHAPMTLKDRLLEY